MVLLGTVVSYIADNIILGREIEFVHVCDVQFIPFLLSSQSIILSNMVGASIHCYFICADKSKAKRCKPD